MTVPLSRRRASARHGARLSEQAIDAEKARQRAESDAHAEAIKARLREARAIEAARVRLTADDVAGATHARDSLGWHRVVRINRTSITVATPYSWTDRIPLDRVLEVRTIKEEA